MATPPDRTAHGLPSNAITSLPITLQARREPLRRVPGQPLKRRKRAAPAPANVPIDDAHSNADGTSHDNGNDADVAVAALSMLSDTHVAALTLRSQWPGEATHELPRTPPLILRSQLYALVADATAVDQQLSSLVLDGTLRHIHIPGCKPSATRRDAFIMTRDFAPHAATDTNAEADGNANTDRSVLRTLFEDVFETCPHPVIEVDVLRRVYGIKKADDAIDHLVCAGYLTMTAGVQSYAFTIPGMGRFIQHRKTGHDLLLGILRRAPYHEMPLKELEMRTLKGSMFTAQWHVRDIVGSGVANTISTTIGTLVRLPSTSRR